MWYQTTSRILRVLIVDELVVSIVDSGQVLRCIVREDLWGIGALSCRRRMFRRSGLPGRRMRCRHSSSWCIRTLCLVLGFNGKCMVGGQKLPNVKDCESWIASRVESNYSKFVQHALYKIQGGGHI